jgi:hypothetical protein
MDPLYLISHRVRGELAYDVALRSSPPLRRMPGNWRKRFIRERVRSVS